MLTDAKKVAGVEAMNWRISSIRQQNHMGCVLWVVFGLHFSYGRPGSPRAHVQSWSERAWDSTYVYIIDPGSIMMSYIPSFSRVQVNDCLKYIVKNTLDLERSALTYLILVMLESTVFTLSGYQMTQGPFNCQKAVPGPHHGTGDLPKFWNPVHYAAHLVFM